MSQLFTCLHVLLPLSGTPVVGVRPHRYRCCALTATSQLSPLTPVHLSCCRTSCLMSGTAIFTGGCLHSAACFRPLLMPLWLLESWCLERAECKLSCHLSVFCDCNNTVRMNWFAIFWRNYCQLLIVLMMVPKYWLDMAVSCRSLNELLW